MAQAATSLDALSLTAAFDLLPFLIIKKARTAPPARGTAVRASWGPACGRISEVPRTVWYGLFSCCFCQADYLRISSSFSIREIPPWLKLIFTDPVNWLCTRPSITPINLSSFSASVPLRWQGMVFFIFSTETPDMTITLVQHLYFSFVSTYKNLRELFRGLLKPPFAIILCSICITPDC